MIRQDNNRLNVRIDGGLGRNDLFAAIDACVAGQGFGQFVSCQVEDLLANGKPARVLQPYESDS